LVAPLFESNITGRDVYLPDGEWIDYQTGISYTAGWHYIKAGIIPIVMLVKSGSVIPHIKLAQSTKDMDWSEIELKVYAPSSSTAQGLICLPEDNVLNELALNKKGNKFELSNDPYKGKVKFAVTSVK
jgi:alpha-D-xyloside xylohydrolase